MNVQGRSRTPLPGIDEVLASLPAEFVVASQHDTRLAVGPPGAFVLASVPTPIDDDELDQLIVRAEAATAATRVILADHLSWVPFIDTLLVVAGDPPRRPHATFAAVDLLADMIVEGRPVVSPHAVGVVRDLLRRDALGPWMVGVVPDDGRIDLCDPAPQTIVPS